VPQTERLAISSSTVCTRKVSVKHHKGSNIIDDTTYPKFRSSLTDIPAQYFHGSHRNGSKKQREDGRTLLAL
jgi:hypothetical protein